MATKTVARRNAEARAESAGDQSVDNIFEEIARDQSTIKVAGIIEGVAKKLGEEEIAALLTRQIKKGSARDSKMFLQEFLRMLNTHEKKTAAISENEITRLEDDQIDALLESEFGLTPKDRPKAVAKTFREGAMSRSRPMSKRNRKTEPSVEPTDTNP